MKLLLGAAATGLIILAIHAPGDPPPELPTRVAVARLDWEIWPPATEAAAPAAPAVQAALAGPDRPEIDVVDAHWMALTMWGEARGEGEAAMRAVGHVIDNRRRAGLHGAYVTDTVGEAFQFSCWNPGDPNRAAIEAVDDLPHGSSGWRSWQAAQRIAGEIMAGRSTDLTGGALFYHAAEVAPAWSQGIAPVAEIGGHVFFRAARRG